MTNKKYGVIYADPAWKYADGKGSRGVENHYDCMSLTDICELPVSDIAADDCALFLWATNPLLAEALQVIKSWGFTYKSVAFQWVKYNKKSNTPFMGMGRWTRGNSEPCLLATRGKPHRVDAGVRQLLETFEEEEVLQARRGEHSAKPEEARIRIEQLMGPDLAKVELFSRVNIPGWDFWGNECEVSPNMKDFGITQAEIKVAEQADVERTVEIQ